MFGLISLSCFDQAQVEDASELEDLIKEIQTERNLSLTGPNAKNVMEDKLNSILSLTEKALALKPNDMQAAVILYYRGWVYYNKGEYFEAISDFSKSIELNPKKTEVFRSRAAVYMFRKEYDKAIADYSKVIDLVSTRDFGIEYFFRGNAYTTNNQYKKAISDYDVVINLLFDRAKEVCSGKEYEKLTKECIDREIEKILSDDSRLVMAFYGMAISLRTLGKKTEAIKSYKQLIKYGKNGIASPVFLEIARKGISDLGGEVDEKELDAKR